MTGSASAVRTQTPSQPPDPPGIDAIDFSTRKNRSLWSDAWQRLISNKVAVLGMAIVALFLVSSVLAHFFWEYNPKTDLDYSLRLMPPNLRPTAEVESVHPFGTDKLGRDIFRRVVHGGWNSLRVGIVAVGISLSIGVTLGLFAGFYESMDLGRKGQVVLIGGIGLVFGAFIAWLTGVPWQAAFFLGLGAIAALFDDLWAGQPRRTALFAGAGLLLGGLPALSLSPIAILLVALLGALVGAIVALPLGGTLVSQIIMRVMDILLAFPGILLAIAIVAILGPGLEKGMIAIGIVGIPIYARLMRSTVLSVIPKDFVFAAQAVGVRQGRLLFGHILPNTLSPITVQATMGLAAAILSAAALGFLGLGAIPPEPEWGAMLGDSYRYLTSGAWWAVLFPGMAIMLTVLGFNLLGDGLRDSLDPRMKNR